MKKIISSIFVFVLLLETVVGACAALPETINPLWANIKNMNTTITFVGANGSVTSDVYGMSGTTAISGNLSVYKQTASGTWEFVDSTSGSVQSRYMLLTLDFDVEKNVNYKAVFSVSVTLNGFVETETTSQYKTYT